MSIIKDYKKARKKIEQISNRFNLSKRKKELKIAERILYDVKRKGDKALVFYTKKFDKYDLKKIKVSKSGIKNSSKHSPNKLLISIKLAIKRIKTFHKTNLPQSWTKTFNLKERLGYKYIPLDSVGIYIPGGKNPLISTVLMTVIPAKIAGVKRIALCSPPPIHKGILAACKLLGIKEIYQVGGAQAIAALTFGTETIKPVNKIVGPGNIYVTLAKKLAFGKVGIDGLFGPSEIAIIADKTAKPEYLAIDLLSQLEHGSGLESAILITNNQTIAKETQKELLKLSKSLPNKKTVLNSWKNNSVIILVKNINKGIDLINELAPEHLEIITKNSNQIAKKINNAGAVFLGEYSCESIGDYLAGPSHCLPTSGSAKFSSGLTVMDFMKKISIISFDKKSFNKVAKGVLVLANAEGLKAHGDAVKMRLEASLRGA